MKTWRRLAIPYLIWGTCMLLLPMLLIVFYSVIQPGNEVTTFRFTLANYIRFFTDPDFLLILWRSLTIAVETTAICLLIGYPIAYWISRCSKKTQNLMVLAITLPMWINMLVRTYAWIGILSKGGPVSIVLSWFGIKDAEILYTQAAVLIGMVYNYLPYMILQIHSSLTKMDPSLEEAASDLGASPFQTFWRVTFPLSIPGVISGITLVFLPAISAFFIPKLLGGGWFLIGNVIENQFITVGEWNFGSAISVIMAMIMMLLMSLVRKADRKASQKEKNA